jgi:hypothetical protein
VTENRKLAYLLLLDDYTLRRSEDYDTRELDKLWWDMTDTERREIEEQLVMDKKLAQEAPQFDLEKFAKDAPQFDLEKFKGLFPYSVTLRYDVDGLSVNTSEGHVRVRLEPGDSEEEVARLVFATLEDLRHAHAEESGASHPSPTRLDPLERAMRNHPTALEAEAEARARAEVEQRLTAVAVTRAQAAAEKWGQSKKRAAAQKRATALSRERVRLQLQAAIDQALKLEDPRNTRVLDDSEVILDEPPDPELWEAAMRHIARITRALEQSQAECADLARALKEQGAKP